MKHAVQVTILGQQYTIKSQALPSEVRRVADFVNQKLAEIGGGGRTADTLDGAVLTLMNIAGAYLNLRDEVSATEEASERLQLLVQRLEEAEAATGDNNHVSS